MDHQLHIYEDDLVRVFRQITKTKPVETLDHYDLAKLFEIWSCIQLSQQGGQLYTLWEDTDCLFKDSLKKYI